ncbi:hypothetical protein BJX64DRAFT_279657 [Aspergillus heterothallicus]
MDSSQSTSDAEQNAPAKVNSIVLSDISCKLKAYPSMDMTSILEQKLKTYPILRQVFRNGAVQSTKATPASPKPYQIPLDVTVIRSLGMAVLHAVDVDSQSAKRISDPSSIYQRLNDLVADSEIIWQLGSTAVLGLGPDLWKSLSADQTASVRDRLDNVMQIFRSLPAPPCDDPHAILGSGNPRPCKDTRRHVRFAEEPIANEAVFNAYISSNHQRSDSGYISETGEHHRVEITAILDWEMSGWYPEYWEYVKALHTIASGDGFDDWYAYLPPSIGVWPKEHAVDLMLSRWHG